MKQSNTVGFLIVGAAKAGTTTLYETLARHPGIFMPNRKEGRYFSRMPVDFAGPKSTLPKDLIQSPEEYRALFRAARPDQLCGDASPDYLYAYRNAIPGILDEVGARIPIIIVLRNPIDRTYSNYLQHVRDGWETLGFEEALNAEQERRAANWAWGWGYVHISLYAEQVKAYMDSFERVLLLLFEEDIVTGRAREKILRFLNLDSLPESADNIHANVSGYPKHRWLHRLMTDELVVRKVKNLIKATPLYSGSKRVYRKIQEANLKQENMSPETREMLREKFRENVALLAEQTGVPVQKFWTDFQ